MVKFYILNKSGVVVRCGVCPKGLLKSQVGEGEFLREGDPPELKQSVVTSYRHDRKVAYPSIEEQLDILYHEGLDSWRAIIKEIKDKHPKNSGSS